MLSTTLSTTINSSIGSTPVQLTDTQAKCQVGLQLAAPTGNATPIYIGNSDVSLSGTNTGFPISPRRKYIITYPQS